MREILFRGQTRKFGQYVNMAGDKLPGKWVYGGVFQGAGDYSIIYGAKEEDFTGADLGKHVVYSDTLCQYTGLKDCRGQRIFEGDIIKCLSGEIMVVAFGQHSDKYYKGTAYGWYVYDAEVCLSLDHGWAGHEVIGNIHDNPELLEGGILNGDAR